MSHLARKDTDGEWFNHPLNAEPVELTPDGPKSLAARERLGALSNPILMPSRASDGDDRWLLMCPPGSRTRVNGLPVLTGARVLADRDAITIGAGPPVWFSAEKRAEIVPFVGDHSRCMRCKLPLEPGTLAVRCPSPGCGFYFHQTEDSPCWTYAEGCAACGYPTDLNAGFQWSPAEL